MLPHVAPAEISLQHIPVFHLRARVGLQPWYRHTARRVTTLTSGMVNVGYVYLWEDIFYQPMNNRPKIDEVKLCSLYQYV